ncbi:MAG: pectate lyase [Marinoscillum sp.]|uniref:pectate lyase n=2 Tax=Marinoscillum sp. TaxID=2024838 RepID=UPI0032FC95DE
MKSIAFFLLFISLHASAQIAKDSIAEDMLIFQRTVGGWPKHIPLRGKKEIKVNYEKLNLTDRERLLIRADSGRLDATYDNGATTKEIRYLVQAYQRTRNPEYLEAAEKGIAYILAGQYQDTGGWPQFYPLRGGYPNHITYNDNSMVNLLNILRDVVDGKNGFEVVSPSFRESSQKAIAKGIDCMLKTQIVTNGKLTVWCAQHDELTLLPAKARAYELPSYSGQESVGIVRFLMGVENPSDSIMNAIQSGVQWLEDHKIEGYTIEFQKNDGQGRGYDRVLVPKDGAVTWARFYDLETEQPFFCGRDGVKKANMTEIEYERRVGYGWYGEWPKDLLEKDWPEWKEKNLK